MQHHVGDIAVDEQITRQHADDFVGRHAGVGAADPEEFRSLLAGQLGEEVGVALVDRVGPAGVVVDQFLQVVHGRCLIRVCLRDSASPCKVSPRAGCRPSPGRLHGRRQPGNSRGGGRFR
ncbi:hypothetical protein D3C75_1136350 [compost metagenome]